MCTQVFRDIILMPQYVGEEHLQACAPVLVWRGSQKITRPAEMLICVSSVQQTKQVYTEH